MKALIRGFTSILAFALFTANAQLLKDSSSYASVVSGTSYAFYNSQGSGTLTFTFSFAGTPSGVSIAVQGCGADGVTCTTLTPITGANPYVTSSSGQVTYAGGYNQYKVTPTFSGTSLSLYLTGIQAKVNSGGGGGATTFDQIGSGTNTGHGLVCGAGCVLSASGGGFVNANEVNGGTSPNSALILGTNSTGQLVNNTNAIPNLNLTLGAGVSGSFGVSTNIQAVLAGYAGGSQAYFSDAIPGDTIYKAQNSNSVKIGVDNGGGNGPSSLQVYQSTINSSVPIGETSSTIASATTIAPTTPMVILTGTTPIATVTVPSGFASGCFDAYNTSTNATTTAGNIAAVYTLTAATQYRWCFYPSPVAKWVVK